MTCCNYKTELQVQGIFFNLLARFIKYLLNCCRELYNVLVYCISDNLRFCFPKHWSQIQFCDWSTSFCFRVDVFSFISFGLGDLVHVHLCNRLFGFGQGCKAGSRKKWMAIENLDKDFLNWKCAESTWNI